MNLSRIKLYIILFLACVAGYIWLYFGITTNHTVEVCIIKHATNIPCPSCGSTRSVISLIYGDFVKALYINPFGFVIALIMLLTPLWIIIDLSSKGKTLFDFYCKIERSLKKPRYAIPMILLVIINWIWNIIKGL